MIVEDVLGNYQEKVVGHLPNRRALWQIISRIHCQQLHGSLLASANIADIVPEHLPLCTGGFLLRKVVVSALQLLVLTTKQNLTEPSLAQMLICDGTCLLQVRIMQQFYSVHHVVMRHGVVRSYPLMYALMSSK